MAQTGQTQVPVLEKMEIADILDAAIRLYRHNFLVLLEIAAAVQVVILAGYLILIWAGLGPIMMTPSEEVPWASLLGMIPAILVLAFAGIILYPLSEGALAFAVSEMYLGRRISALDAYQRIAPLLWRLLVTMILVGLAVGLGSIFCLVPGILCYVWFCVSTPVVAVERRAGPDAMSRSHNLVSGHGWRVFGTLLLLYLIVSVASYAITLVPNLVVMLVLSESYPLLAQSLAQGISSVAQILVRPVLMIGFVLIYYDLRIRKEGFDLVMLAEAMESSSRGDAVAYEPGGFRPASLEPPPEPEKQAPLPPRPGEPEEGLPPPPA